MDSLNPEQRRSVDTLTGPLLILAGAGAGKTKTLTHRILNLIIKGAEPASILAITFTNKAAKEMRERVNKLISDSKEINRPISMNERPFVSTFHALGVHILKEQSTVIGIPRHFVIFDKSDSKRVVKNALEEIGLDPKQYDPMKILSAISREKGECVTHKEYAAKAKDFFQKLVSQVWEKYEAVLNKEKALDFDDLLLKTAKLLETNEAVRKYYATKWQHIHIDEYQDTNGVQYAIAKLLARDHRNMCVVGDIDQNIYSWRGANIENILNFEKDYPEAQVILLEQNYRSTKTILSAANKIIEKNTMRRKKNLFTENADGERITLLELYDENEEARTVAEKCRELIDAGTAPDEIAILYRANFQSRVIEEAFLQKSLPYQLLGTKFFERKEVKDVISFIRAALNPDSTSDLVRIINVPPRGIGKTTVLKIVSGAEASLPQATKIKVAAFKEVLGRIAEFALREKPSDTIKFVLRESGLEKSFRDGTADDQERLENAREIVTVAAKYDLMTPQEGIEAFLADAALASDQDELAEERKGVKLMTVHASKGLEFENVFIVGLEQDLFPHARMGHEHATQSEAEEERRLFYVAVTRARKKLFLSWAQIRTIYGTSRVNIASEFIGDIDDDLIEREEREVARGVKAIFIDF